MLKLQVFLDAKKEVWKNIRMLTVLISGLWSLDIFLFLYNCMFLAINMQCFILKKKRKRILKLKWIIHWSSGKRILNQYSLSELLKYGKKC